MINHKNELSHIREMYLSNGSFNIQYRGDETHVRRFISVLPILHSFEKPDMYAYHDDIILSLEHFEVDGSKFKKKRGSQQRSSESAVLREFDSLEDSTSFHGQLPATYSLSNYKSNLNRIFQHHYSQIDSYKFNLLNFLQLPTSTQFYTGFFIEDVTTLTALFDHPSLPGPIPIPLLHCDFFLDLFEQNPSLDFVVFASLYNCEQGFSFIDRASLSEYRVHQLETSQAILLNSSPQYTGFIAPLDS